MEGLVSFIAFCMCNGFSNNPEDGKCVFFNTQVTELVRQLSADRKIIGH